MSNHNHLDESFLNSKQLDKRIGELIAQRKAESYWSFCVLGTIAQPYRHKTKHDAIHHVHEMRKWRPDFAGYCSHRCTFEQVKEYLNSKGWVCHPPCVPET